MMSRLNDLRQLIASNKASETERAELTRLVMQQGIEKKRAEARESRRLKNSKVKRIYPQYVEGAQREQWGDNVYESFKSREPLAPSKRKAGDVFSEDDTLQFLIDLDDAGKSSQYELPSAYENLMSRTRQFKENDAALIEAGVKPSDMPAGFQQLDTGMLKGGVPGPYIKHKKGIENRLHLRKDDSGELVPFINRETGTPLITRLGNVGADPAGTQNEIVGLQALKLMDDAPVKMNRQVRQGRPMHHYADAKVGEDKVEMMIAQRGAGLNNTMAIPTYTNIVGEDVKREIMVLKSQGLSTEQAVEQLINAGAFEDTGLTRWGKIGRSGIENVRDREAVYDKLLVSGYPVDLVRDSKAVKYNNYRHNPHPQGVDFANDTLAVAPETLHMVDLPGLRAAINSGDVNTRTIVTTGNRGHDQRGHERAKVQEIITQGGNPFVQDLTASHPYTQQILKNLPYV